jgi:hypothetical protein
MSSKRHKVIKSNRFFVYIYRDKNNNNRIRYVGYGKAIERPTSRNHSELALKFLASTACKIEVAGPYHEKSSALAVETALISVLTLRFNSKKAPGPNRFRFRALGVPEKFCRRLACPVLSVGDFKGSKTTAFPLLFVYINEKKLDERVGYNPSDPPEDAKILARMKESWLLGRYINHWAENPDQTPKTLIGVTGPPLHRIILGAVRIDSKRLLVAKPDHGLFKVPTKRAFKDQNLDAFGLRGRLVSSKIKFGWARHRFFLILNRNGRFQRLNVK